MTARSALGKAVLTVAVVYAAIVGTVLTATATLTAALTLTATALIVPGTGTPDPSAVPGFMTNAVSYYVAPTTPSCAVVCDPQPVPYIAQFWPFPFAGWGGLSGAKLDVSVDSGVRALSADLAGDFRPSAQNPVVVFGYSQGATVASRQKSDLRTLSPADQADIAFTLIGNPNRPNGGLFERLAAFGTVPVLDATFGLPTPTDTAMSTVDISFEYDGVSDYPLYPLNLLADLNAIAGFWYIHGSYLTPNGKNPDGLPNGLTPAELAAAIADPANQQRFPGSDTTYVLIPTPNLPLLQPLRDFGAMTGTQFITTPLIDLIQPALKVLIDTGYDRTLPYGQPAPWRLLGPVDPIGFAGNLADAIGQGVRDALADISGQITTPTAPGPAATVSRPTVPPPSAAAPNPQRAAATVTSAPESNRRTAAKAAAAQPASVSGRLARHSGTDPVGAGQDRSGQRARAAAGSATHGRAA